MDDLRSGSGCMEWLLLGLLLTNTKQKFLVVPPIRET
jgi:hypothetical protein